MDLELRTVRVSWPARVKRQVVISLLAFVVGPEGAGGEEWTHISCDAVDHIPLLLSRLFLGGYT